jgi:FdhD protein
MTSKAGQLGVSVKGVLLRRVEPLEISVLYSRNGTKRSRAVAVTMRTPGHDDELAAGFLLSEGVLHSREQIESVRVLGSEGAASNQIQVELANSVDFEEERFTRHFYMSSSCGICGKASIENIETFGSFAIDPNKPILNVGLIAGLPERLQQAQEIFAVTGGLHAAALFSMDGTVVALREDVGRHNAVDKVLGSLLLRGAIPATNSILALSGRLSFELVQKAVVAGIPVIVAIGAPSSLAIELGKRFQLTLVGFLRGKKFNVYSGEQRLMRL